MSRSRSSGRVGQQTEYLGPSDKSETLISGDFRGLRGRTVIEIAGQSRSAEIAFDLQQPNNIALPYVRRGDNIMYGLMMNSYKGVIPKLHNHLFADPGGEPTPRSHPLHHTETSYPKRGTPLPHPQPHTEISYPKWVPGVSW